MIKSFLSEIEGIIAEDYGNRGLNTMVQKEDFQGAVEELYNNSQRVLIITGFCIKDAMIGETDGPSGAVSIGNALTQLGKEVLFVTDEFSVDLVKACCGALNINTKIEVAPLGDTRGFCKRVMDEFRPTDVLAIERPGRAMDGRCYSMRGEDISPFVPNTDYFFNIAKERNIPTIAIGDGGNEMGMGKIAQTITKQLKEGAKISAVTAADYLIISGVSNWGGHGIAAGLSLLASEILLHTPMEEVKMISAMVEAGGVDGCSKKREMTVDGLSLELNLEIFNRISEVAVKGLKLEKAGNM